MARWSSSQATASPLPAEKNAWPEPLIRHPLKIGGTPAATTGQPGTGAAAPPINSRDCAFIVEGYSTLSAMPLPSLSGNRTRKICRKSFPPESFTSAPAAL